MITNEAAGTRIDEVESGIYRINTPLDVIPGGFTFNSYLIAGEEPLLFHAGYRKLFPLTVEAVKAVMPVEKLRWVGGSHFEGDEFGALILFVITLAFLIWQYVSIKRIAAKEEAEVALVGSSR